MVTEVSVPSRTFIASELILPTALAVQNRIDVTDLAQTLSVYRLLAGSEVEAAGRLMAHDDLDEVAR